MSNKGFESSASSRNNSRFRKSYVLANIVLLIIVFQFPNVFQDLKLEKKGIFFIFLKILVSLSQSIIDMKFGYPLMK
jgi:hypothetical protein